MKQSKQNWQNYGIRIIDFSTEEKKEFSMLTTSDIDLMKFYVYRLTNRHFLCFELIVTLSGSFQVYAFETLYQAVTSISYDG